MAAAAEAITVFLFSAQSPRGRRSSSCGGTGAVTGSAWLAPPASYRPNRHLPARLPPPFAPHRHRSPPTPLALLAAMDCPPRGWGPVTTVTGPVTTISGLLWGLTLGLLQGLLRGLLPGLTAALLLTAPVAPVTAPVALAMTPVAPMMSPVAVATGPGVPVTTVTGLVMGLLLSGLVTGLVMGLLLLGLLLGLVTGLVTGPARGPGTAPLAATRTHGGAATRRRRRGKAGDCRGRPATSGDHGPEPRTLGHGAPRDRDGDGAMGGVALGGCWGALGGTGRMGGGLVYWEEGPF